RARASRAARAARVVLALALAAAAVGSVSCGRGGRGSGKPVVVFWEFFPTEQVGPVIDGFRRENPDLDVRVEQLTWQSGLEKLTAAVAGGNVPDLCELGSTWFPGFAHQGALADWSDSTRALRDRYLFWNMTDV